MERSEESQAAQERPDEQPDKAVEQTENSLKGALATLSSPKLTVVLLALASFLVFAGTLAQVDRGLWTVMSGYFRSTVAWIELQVFFPRAWDVPGRFPYPGGWTIGGLLLINLLAAQVSRFKLLARGARFGVGVLVLIAGFVLTGLVIAGYFSQGVAATEADAFWRVMWRLAQGGIAAVVLLVASILLYERRAGLALLHAGTILLLLSELITATAAIEGQMTIEEGRSSNFVVENRSSEIVVIDRSSSEWDEVVSVPRGLLRPGRRVSHPDLPFDIQTDTYLRNAILVNAKEDAQWRAEVGKGQFVRAVSIAESAGADSNQTLDHPAIHVTVFEKGKDEPLKHLMVSVWMAERGSPIPQKVTVGDKTYDVLFRFRRHYKPYSIHLIEFRHDKYIGTEIPKNFSSEVRLVDPERNVDRKVKIWMNNPLRYAGETFYQAAYRDDRTTVLQVVRNAGWMVPYVSSMIVALGLLWQFGLQMATFLRKRGNA